MEQIHNKHNFGHASDGFIHTRSIREFIYGIKQTIFHIYFQTLNNNETLETHTHTLTKYVTSTGFLFLFSYYL